METTRGGYRQQAVNFAGVLVRRLAVASLLVACASGESALPPGSELEQLLIGALPEGWTLVEESVGQAPPGHGPVPATGRPYVLQGPGPVWFQWRDEAGEWHQEALARETLELWVMPGSYRPSLRRFLEQHRHIPPAKIYSSRRVRVYAQVSHRVTDEVRFEEVLRFARSTSWSDIAEKSCTWEGWARELAAAFRSTYG